MDDNRNKQHFLYNKNIQDAIFFFVISMFLIIYALSNHYGERELQWMLSPYLFPIFTGIVTALLSFILFYQGMKEYKSSYKADKKGRMNLRGIMGTLILVITYYVSMRVIDFIPSNIIFISVFSYFLGEKRFWLLALASIITTLAIYVIFGEFLNVMLP